MNEGEQAMTGPGDDDLVYLLRRAAEERKRATESRDDVVRLTHQAMADAYQRRTAAMGSSGMPKIFAPRTPATRHAGR
jgi:hypothetical protein